MEYIYSAMLLHAAGKEITEQGITKVLKAAGVTPDEARVKALTASLEGVNIEEAIATPAQVAAAPAPAPAAGEPPAKEEKKGEKKEDKKDKEASEEDAAAGLGALFG
ncbi:MAG: 50S ribosomal protein P1 [Methanomassiliicoccales archaeon]|nr:MAG: 50S ribosomal protein P1 [Methanomassiliicoccales archaeon]